MTVQSVPIPTTYRDVSDLFVAIALNAPDFEFLNRHVNYTITLDMMMNSLRIGIDAVAGRTKRPEALRLYEMSRAEIDIAHELYRKSEISNAKQSMYKAQNHFEQAGNQRSRKREIRFGSEDRQSKS